MGTEVNSVEDLNRRMTLLYTELRRGDLNARRLEAVKYFPRMAAVPEFLLQPRNSFEVSATSMRSAIVLGGMIATLSQELEREGRVEEGRTLKQLWESLAVNDTEVGGEELLATFRRLGVLLSKIRDAQVE